MFGSTKILPLSQLMDQEIEEKNLNNSNQSPATVSTHTRTIEIIHPPHNIQSIVERTAKFIAKKGVEIEKRIIGEHAKNAKFNFLSSSSPYHTFYQHKLIEYRTQIQATGPVVKCQAVDAKHDLQAQFRVPSNPLEPPEPEKYTVKLPEGITSEELDIIRLTAQFVARNGESFFNGLLSRENDNPQFHFMNPAHSVYTFFTALIDAYSFIPPNDVKEKLRKDAADFKTVLELCLHRLEWDRFQEQQRKKEEDEKEQERVKMAMIDWHDFVVVESIDFTDEEIFQRVMTTEVMRKSKVSAMEELEVVEPIKEVEMEMDEEEFKLVSDGTRAVIGGCGSMQIEYVNDEETPIRIVKNWKRPEDRILTERDLTKVVISPINGELIPINEMSEHMRISLIDPKFREHKDRMFAKIRETTLAQDDEIAKNIVGLARLRPDIFGTTEEEVSNAVKAEIERKKDEQPHQLIWDGHTGSIERTTNQALTKNPCEEEQGDGVYGESNSFPGSATLLPCRQCVPIVRPLPLPPNLTLNFPYPPPSVQYPTAPMSLGVPMKHHSQHQLLMPGALGRPSLMMNQSPQMQPGMPVLLPPGSQFVHLRLSPNPMGIMQPPPIPGSEEAPLPFPEESEPKRRKFYESSPLVPEDQFLA